MESSVSQAKAEMRRALEAESDKKKRRQVEKQWKAKIAALEESPDVCTSDLSSFRLIDTGKSKGQLAAEQREEEARLEMEKKVDAYRKLDKSVPELEQILALILPAKLRIHQIAADGDCLFRAIEHQLDLHKSLVPKLNVSKLRSVAACWVERNENDVLPFLDDPSPAGFASLVNTIRNTNEFGGELELRALSDSLGVAIKVYQASGAHCYNEGKEPVLTLSFHRHMFASSKQMFVDRKNFI